MKVLLHELPFDELMAGLRDAALELAVVLRPTGERVTGIEFRIAAHLPDVRRA